MELRAGSKPSCYSECQRQKPDVRLVLPTKPSLRAELTQLWGKLNGVLCVCSVSVCLRCVSVSSAAQLPGGHGRARVAGADTTPGEARRAASWCSKGSSRPWCMCWRKQGDSLPQGPLPRTTWLRWHHIWLPPPSLLLQHYPSRHYTVKCSSCPLSSHLPM